MIAGFRLAALSCRALTNLAEQLANRASTASASESREPSHDEEAQSPDELALVAVASTILCQSTADPTAVMKSWMQSSLKQHEPQLAKLKAVAMRQLPRSQQSSAVLRVMAAW